MAKKKNNNHQNSNEAPNSRDNELEVAIGREVREFRQKMDLTVAELAKLEHALKTIQATLALHAGPKFANTKCPIMGSPINPAKVTDSLVRTYKGQKVAFCCAGCPSAWDKLSSNQKVAKFKAAGTAPVGMHQHSGHNH